MEVGNHRFILERSSVYEGKQSPKHWTVAEVPDFQVKKDFMFMGISIEKSGSPWDS